MRPRATSDRAACQEAHDAALFGAPDPGVAARVARHIARCADCAAMGARLGSLTAELERDDRPLDDVARARMRDRLAARLDDLAADRARRPAALAPGRLLVGGALLALAAGVLLLVRPPSPAPPPHPAHPVAKAPVLPPAPQPAANPILRPGTNRAVIRVGENVTDRLAVPRAARVRATLSDHTRLVLIGPATISVLAASEGVLELALAEGTLVGEHDHDSQRRLRVHSPDAVVAIVGTTFMIEARPGKSRIAVADGLVAVEPVGAAPRAVAAGQLWSTDAAEVKPAPRAVTQLFAAAAPALARSGAAEPPKSAAAPRGPSHLATLDRLALPEPAKAKTLPPSLPQVPAGPAPTRAEARPPTPHVPAPVEAPPPAVLAPAPTPAPAMSAAEIYRLAEAAMARADEVEARRRLEEVAALATAGPLANLARYELAQRALASGDHAHARRLVEGLAQVGGALAESVHLLACEIELGAGNRAAARACYERFRQRFPDGAHALEALSGLIRLMPSAEDCGAGLALLRGYLAAAPAGALAADVAARLARCDR
jgi:ferric-dicitrate binding protein FerR (iron transport regulator)